jgi:hypothetical protein
VLTFFSPHATDEAPPPVRALIYIVQIPILIGLYKTANGIHDAIRGSSTSKKQADAAKKVEGKAL